MLKFLLGVVLIGVGFAGGFYAGVKYRTHELVENPREFAELYGSKLKRTASDELKGIIDRTIGESPEAGK
jgi:hypothetical protein